MAIEPEFPTDPALLGILGELKAREPIFHRPELGTGRTDFAAQMADDFWEIGASGKRYSQELAPETLEQRWARPPEDPWETSDFHCRELCVELAR